VLIGSLEVNIQILLGQFSCLVIHLTAVMSVLLNYYLVVILWILSDFGRFLFVSIAS